MTLQTPGDVRYGEGDLWARPEGDLIRVGITDHAQDQLGDIIYVELPQVGDEVAAGRSMGEVESQKTVSDLISPVTGRVAEANGDLGDRPELLNQAPYGDGWLVVVEPTRPDELDDLMTADEYADQRS